MHKPEPTPAPDAETVAYLEASDGDQKCAAMLRQMASELDSTGSIGAVKAHLFKKRLRKIKRLNRRAGRG